MEGLLKVKPTLLRGGERFPVVTSESGMPIYYPNIYLVSELRRQNNQFYTLQSAAGAINVLRRWEILSGIEIVDRMTRGSFLEDFELDSLTDALWRTCDFLDEQIEIRQDSPSGKVRSLAAYRRKHSLKDKDATAHVKAGTFSVRAVYVAGYLKFLGGVAVKAAAGDASKRVALQQELERVVASIYVSIPEGHGNAEMQYHRLGLSYEMEAVLREVIEPGHRLNPWSEGTQLRNSMIIKILLGIGIRRGELLNLRIDDIDFRTNKIFIRRLPDNREDPRLCEPNVKTLPRMLTITDSLADVIHDYIVNERRNYRYARKHDFLVVSTDDGSPLSLSGLNTVFAAVRANVPGIPLNFGPHICRHTWNDRYSDFCDEKKISEEKERKTRCKIMGWKPGSRMAEVYTKRSSQEAVDKMMLAQQQFTSNGRLRGVLDEFSFNGEYAE